MANDMENLLKEITLVSNDNLLLRDRIRKLEAENAALQRHIHESTKLFLEYNSSSVISKQPKK